MNFIRLFTCLFAMLPGLAVAQPWPAHPISIIMGFPAGSGVDVVARMLQEPMEKSLGTKLVMDYRTGAGGNLASEAVFKARPDGYTLLLGTAATHGVNAALYKRLPFDVEADFNADLAARQCLQRADDQSAGDRRAHGARIHRHG